MRVFATGVVLPLALVVAGIFAAVAVVLDLAAEESDADALTRQTALVAGAVERSIAQIVWQQESVTVWDQTILNLRTPDPDWLDGNAGIWLHEYFGIDEVFILDAAGKPVYAMAQGSRVSPQSYRARAPLIDPIVSRLRAATAGGAESAVHDVVTIAGRPAIVGLSLVVSDSGEIEQVPGTEFAHVAVRFMDGTYLEDLSDKALVTRPEIVDEARASPLSGHYPVAASDGTVVAGIAWTADRPGTRMLRAALPALGGAALLVTLIVGMMIRRLWRTTSALKSSEAEARQLAFSDPLTGLANRARFNADIEEALERLTDGARIALIYVDLDRFKYVNDTFGHHAGDDLIRQVGRRLQAMVRPGDAVARLGGDEFAVIQSGVREDGDVAALCERILHKVAEPYPIGSNAAYVGASLGVVVAPDEGVDGAELTRKADIALYSAKTSGRNVYRMFAPEMDVALRRRQRLESDLRHALTERRGITVAFQPIVDVNSDPAGVEALVRWTHPDLGTIPPTEFVPIAEETGLIGEIGDLVLAAALPVAAACRVPLSVNVSPVQLLTASFPARLVRMVADTGILPSAIELEITETVLLDGQDMTRNVLEGLRDAGFRIALDDFGTGYSSLAYLRAFPVDRIKIDRSFVRTLSTDRDAARIVAAVADLGRALGKNVTAEGVETREQFNALVAAGCDAFQGHLFSPAVTAGEVVEFVRGPAERRTGRIAPSRGAA